VTVMSAEQGPRSAEISEVATAADAVWALAERGQTVTRLDKIRTVRGKFRMSSSISLRWQTEISPQGLKPTFIFSYSRHD
jgi:hypothetical protein